MALSIFALRLPMKWANIDKDAMLVLSRPVKHVDEIIKEMIEIIIFF